MDGSVKPVFREAMAVQSLFAKDYDREPQLRYNEHGQK